MTLRSGAVEAMARALRAHNFGTDYWPDDWAERATWERQANAALDALLVFLGEHTEEWKREAYALVDQTDRDVFGSAALAVLGSGEEKP